MFSDSWSCSKTRRRNDIVCQTYRYTTPLIAIQIQYHETATVSSRSNAAHRVVPNLSLAKELLSLKQSGKK